ncbi:hypothetical protein LWC34_27170 [Kibdelosporangium philippinense]|uniref:Uncharacterized protein n=1 Tax=Kibdelosporangium philippinense TaxID=211113 RepID=A0ABS8ZG24_9PSEU|nr:hypothetical protein [Kibdelosporangium philippinense]MCE7006482.1 hypothetical protein [Kibdelosporangium philippinense]
MNGQKESNANAERTEFGGQGKCLKIHIPELSTGAELSTSHTTQSLLINPHR